MGPVDPRPVQPDSLFQLFSAGSPLLSILTLQLTLDRGAALQLGKRVAAAWPAFGAAGKDATTLLELLSHRAGLADSFPADVPLSRLCDPTAMAAHVAARGARAASQPR